MEDVTYPVHCQDLSLRRKIEKIKDKRVALEKTAKAEVVAISTVHSFQLNDSTPQRLNTSTTQHLNDSTSLQINGIFLLIFFYFSSIMLQN